jgi:hypothetical protein
LIARQKSVGPPAPGLTSYPANFFLVNPEVAGGSATVLRNSSNSTYHALQIELRRRFSAGLLFNWNHVFSKGLTDHCADSQSSGANYYTLRNGGMSKGLSPYDLTHQWKANWTCELPFGHGQRWLNHGGVLDRLVGGWEIHGVARIQSRLAFILDAGRGAFNQYGSGVIPKVTREELQSMGKITKSPDKRVYVVDLKLIGPDGRANPAYLDTPTTAGQRGYLVGGATAANVATSTTSTTFGQTTSYYTDISTTNDPGGRIVQLVLWINF